MSNTPQIRTIDVFYRDRTFNLEYFYRPGHKETILFVHGLGGAKENFWEACKTADLAGYTLICFDNPGTGNSTYYEDMILEVDDLVEITNLFIKQQNIKQYILCGASMGGLITMLYMQKYGMTDILAYINIEGNLMPEDCMFSSKVVRHAFDYFSSTVFPDAIVKMKESGNAGYHIIANNLELNTNVKSYYHYSFQTVSYSATGELLSRYLNMDLPRLFVFGEENRTLSYLPQLENKQLNVAMISGSNHFVFYDNPGGMYRAIAGFIQSTLR